VHGRMHHCWFCGGCGFACVLFAAIIGSRPKALQLDCTPRLIECLSVAFVSSIALSHLQRVSEVAEHSLFFLLTVLVQPAGSWHVWLTCGFATAALVGSHSFVVHLLSTATSWHPASWQLERLCCACCTACMVGVASECMNVAITVRPLLWVVCRHCTVLCSYSVESGVYAKPCLLAWHSQVLQTTCVPHLLVLGVGIE
jgi:hypothetical protein